MMANNKKSIIGIVGSPGSGKSSVSQEFEKAGCAVINADHINHELMTHPDVISEIVEAFGQAILNPDGQIDRKILGDLVFKEKKALDKLNNIVHPRIFEREKELIEQYQSDPNIKAIVLDVPLLLEVGQQSWCNAIIYVHADQEVRHQRLQESKGWDLEKIKNVEKQQLTLDIKQEISDHMISNNSSISDLAKQTAKILPLILEK